MVKKTKIIIGASLVVVVIIISTIVFIYKYLQKDQEIANQSAIITQNKLAYEDQLKQKADSVQLFTAQVSDLNSKLNETKSKYIGTLTKLFIVMDSLQNSKQSIALSGKDSIGDYVEVPFSGKDGIISYNGYTKAYPTFVPIQSFYNIMVVLDTIPIFSQLEQDKDNIWRIATYTTASKVKLRSSFEIDSSLFVGAKSFVADKTTSSEKAFPSFGIRLKCNLGIASDAIKGTQFNGVFVDASAEAFYKYFNVTYYPFIKIVSGGVFINLDMGSWIWKVL